MSGYAFAEVELRVCGSVKSRCALKDSDTNIRIVVPDKCNIAKAMMSIHAYVEEQAQLGNHIGSLNLSVMMLITDFPSGIIEILEEDVRD